MAANLFSRRFERNSFSHNSEEVLAALVPHFDPPRERNVTNATSMSPSVGKSTTIMHDRVGVTLSNQLIQ